MISNHLLAKYQDLYQKHFDIEISQEEALEGGLQLVRLMELLYENEKQRSTTE